LFFNSEFFLWDILSMTRLRRKSEITIDYDNKIIICSWNRKKRSSWF
jgi:GTPase SAR1 family protein